MRGDICWRFLATDFKEGDLLTSWLVVCVLSVNGEDAMVELPQRPLNGVAKRENRDFLSGGVITSIGDDS